MGDLYIYTGESEENDGILTESWNLSGFSIRLAFISLNGNEIKQSPTPFFEGGNLELTTVPANFQPIRLEDAHKRTKNVQPYTQFYFIEKKTKNLLRDWCD